MPLHETVMFFSLMVIIHATVRFITITTKIIIIIMHVYYKAIIDRTFASVQYSMDVIVHSTESLEARKSRDCCWRLPRRGPPIVA